MATEVICFIFSNQGSARDSEMNTIGTERLEMSVCDVDGL